MKLYMSDLHIGLGNESDDFIYDARLIKLLNELIEMNSDDTELYIVGDFFELTNAVNDGYMANTAVEYAQQCDVNVIDEIINNHKKLIETFQRFSKKNRIYYIVGNHDYYFLFNKKICDKIKEIFKKCEIVPYYYDEEFELFLIHGNQFDPVNRLSKDQNNNILPSFSEYMTKYMNHHFGNIAVEILSEELYSEYQNIYPQLDVFKWLDNLKEKYLLNYDLKKEWIKVFTRLIKTPQVKRWLKVNYPGVNVLSNIFVNNMGGLKLGEAIVRLGMFFRSMNNSNYLLMNAEKLLNESFYIPKEYLIGFGENDIALEEDKVKFLIMGHNHRASLNMIDNSPVEKVYVNTGTWKYRVSRNLGINKNEFVKKKLISYLYVEQKNNRLNFKMIKEEAF